MFTTKKGAYLFLIVVTLVFGGGEIIHLVFSQNKYRIENIPYNLINAITIRFESQGRIICTIRNADSIKAFKKLILSSKEIDQRDVNFHGEKQAYEIKLSCTSNKIIYLMLSEVPYMGSAKFAGIFDKDEFYYQNDSLLNFIKFKIKNERRKFSQNF